MSKPKKSDFWSAPLTASLVRGKRGAYAGNASVLMFIVPFEGTMKMVWIAIAYNLYYSVAYPIYICH